MTARQLRASQPLRRRPEATRGDRKTPASAKTSFGIAVERIMWIIVFTTVYIL
jgi:hypothetical protein